MKKTLKIVHVCPFYSPAIGGVKQVVEELAERQARAGHEVYVFTSDWDKEKRIEKKEDTINDVKVRRFFHIFKVANFVSFWPGVFSALLKEKFDVIHSHVFGHPHFVLSALAAKISKVRYFHTTHCPWSDAHRSFIGNVGLWISYNIFSRWALKNTIKVIAITPWEHEFIKKYGGRDEQIINIPNGMSDIFFERIKNNDFKAKHGIKGKMVLFFGRLNPVKSPDHFVDMAQDILKKRKNIFFVIVGPDEGAQKLVEKKISGEKKILLLGAIRDRKEVVKMYQAADVFVLPSYREGLPLTLFEAMASGLPVVATPCNGVPYEMKDPENGFLVKHGNILEFVEKIEALLDDPELREKVSANNLRKSKSYRWEDIFKKTMEVYEETLI
jgi:glycosyltransferase involved in cell wall biosynthesis